MHEYVLNFSYTLNSGSADNCAALSALGTRLGRGPMHHASVAAAYEAISSSARLMEGGCGPPGPVRVLPMSTLGTYIFMRVPCRLQWYVPLKSGMHSRFERHMSAGIKRTTMRP